MLKIEIEASGSGRIIRLIGRIRGENVETLVAEIADSGEPTSLDLREVTIVDLEAIRFLLGCERQGVALLNCSLYIREWIVSERGHP